jgi:peptide/nickel transport system substrate-binding protein
MDYVQPLQAKSVEGASDLTLIQAPATAVNEYILNTTTAPFDDVRARRALGYAIDQQELSDNLFLGFFKPVQSIMASGSWAYPGDEVSGYPAFDVDKAQELVDELGGLEFTLKTSNTPDFLQQAAAVQAQLARAGITMNIEPVEPSKKIADCFSRQYQACQFVVPGLPDPDGYARPFFDSSAGANPSGLEDAALDDLFAQGRTTVGQEDRKVIYDQVQARMAELVPAVFLSDVPPMRIQASDVSGVIYLPTDAFYLNSAWLNG